MPLNFDQLKQKILHKTQASQNVPELQAERPVAPAKRAFVSNPKTSGLKRGLLDVKSVLAEGNYKLFLKPLIFLLIVFICAKFLMGKMAAQKEVIIDKVSALSIQKEHQADYLVNKDRLLRLEPAFPDINQKGDWLLQALMKTFDSHKIQSNIDGNVTENSDENRVVVSQDVSFQQSFRDLGKFLADVESGDDFMRISELTINKLLDPDSLGENAIRVRFSTVFPKEKYAKKLFKDYDKQMAEIAAATSRQGGTTK